MQSQHPFELEPPAELTGDLQPLLSQLGSPRELEVLVALAANRQTTPQTDRQGLRAYLTDYLNSILIPIELPAIHTAYLHARRGAVRELIALDRDLGKQPRLKPFASGSQAAGFRQLKRLQPMRDYRVVQRYLRAVEEGQAGAWHTLVYGIFLALYSLPLRQGLLSYGHLTLRGFVQAGGSGLSSTEVQNLVEELLRGLPEATERVVGQCF